MKSIQALAIVSVLLALLAAPSAYAGGSVNFILGQKMLDDTDWEELDSQTEFGALITFGKDWPVGIAIDLIASTDDTTIEGVKVDGSTTEIDIGVRKVWERDNMRPFFGGGVAFVNGEIEGSAMGITIKSDDDGVGLWVDGGIFWRLGKRFNLGFEARITRAEIEPSVLGETFDVEAGGEHIGLLLGWGW
jgi:hypothetical protein